MNKNLYLNMAKTNVKNNKSIYQPFIICQLVMVAMFYMLKAIYDVTVKEEFYGNNGMDGLLMIAVEITAIFSGIVILDINIFLQKKRLKEYGLYSILGLEKRHIIKVVLWENLMANLIGILAGLVCGIVFNKFAFMVLDKIVGGNTEIGFKISLPAIALTVMVFGGFFVVSNLLNIIRILKMKPIELLRETKAGEREPKAKWVMAVLGIICIAVGYYLAIMVKNPISSIRIFFVAASFVIVGTYLLFICGIIAILKLIKKNKKLYYNKNNFITISGMLYRMKQNAAGLASICILSTAVLITMFSVISLYVGTEDSVKKSYPRNVKLIVCTNNNYETNGYEEGKYDDKLNAYAKKNKVEIKNVEKYYSFETIGSFKENKFVTEPTMPDEVIRIIIITETGYESLTGKTANLEENEALIYSKEGRKFVGNKFYYGDKSLDIAGSVSSKDAIVDKNALVKDNITIVVKDKDKIREISDSLYNSSVENNDISNDEFYETYMNYYYLFDIKGSVQAKKNFCKGLQDEVGNYDEVAIESNVISEQEYYMALYGSLFFVGIFVGILFIMTTAVIIYYKQVSEGYDDHERFVIMKKVGMSDQEIKETIRRQILMVFFLPIIIAVIHVLVAFRQVCGIMELFGLFNIHIMIVCLLGTIIVYTIGYFMVYSITAGTYYRLVK